MGVGEADQAIPSPDLLTVLQDRDLILDLMVHPDLLVRAATAQARTSMSGTWTTTNTNVRRTPSQKSASCTTCR